MNYLVEYYNEIENGNIIVGEELKTEIDQLIQDLDNPLYYFDEKPGQLRIDFIETFCKHTKSPFNGMSFILELWEKAILQTAYGFKMAESGLRRFNEVILLIARKNGKTTFVAGIDLAEFFLSRGGVDIVCASNTTEQANILFEEINNMREQSPALSKETRSKKNIYHIYSPKTKNKIKKLSAQSSLPGSYINHHLNTEDTVHDVRATTNTTAKYIEDSYVAGPTITSGITKVIDFEISPTFKANYVDTQVWVAYGKSMTTLSGQGDGSIKMVDFVHTAYGDLGALYINPGMSIGSPDSISVTIYRMKRK